MKQFSLVLALVLVAGAGINAQTAGGSADSRARVSAQAGQKKVSADAGQQANAGVERRGNSAEVNAAAKSQADAQADAGQPGLNLEAGTRLSAVLASTLDSRRAEEGQQFLLKTTKDVKAGGRTVIRKGSKLIGHVISARGKAEGEGRSSLLLMIDGVEQGGQVLPLQATFVGVVRQAAQSSLDSDFAGPMPAPSAPRRSSGGGLLGGGGLVGGVTGAVDGAVGTAAQAAGKITGEVTGEVAAEAGRAPFSLAGGVTAAASGSVSGATEFTQSGKDLKLEKGTEFVLSVQAVARGKQED